MNYRIASILIALIIVTARTGPTGPQWIAPVNLLGDSAPITYANKISVMTTTTRYMNVISGQVVRFKDGDQSFAWNFDGSQYVTTFD